MNVVDAVTSAVARVRGEVLAPEDETAQIRAAIGQLPGVELDSDNHRIREYAIQVGVGKHFKIEVELLERVGSLELAAAPVVAAFVPTAEGYVIVRRYWACPGEMLVRVDGSDVRFTLQASARFRVDMKRLFEHGLYHPYVRGFYHWWVAQPSGTIVLDSWYALEPCDERERERQATMIDRRLAERAAR